MSGARIHYKLEDRWLTPAIDRLAMVATGVRRGIGEALVETTRARFDTGTEPFGPAWHALNPAYAAIKRGGGGILVGSSALLRNTVVSQVSGNNIYVGSNRIYAAVHQFGAVIRPVRTKALMFRMGGVGKRGGAGFVRAQSVTIPARPYLGFGPKDQRAVLDVLGVAIGRAIG